MGHISVLVVDDHSLVRAGFRSILGDEDDIDVVGEAKDGAEAVEAAVRARPDVVLMDIRMARMDGLEATRLITADPRLRATRQVDHRAGPGEPRARGVTGGAGVARGIGQGEVIQEVLPEPLHVGQRQNLRRRRIGR